jgi:hypothetical protein
MQGYMGGLYHGAPEGVVPADLEGTDLEQALSSWLKADPAIEMIVADRVYPIVSPPTGELPDLTYQMISGMGVHTLEGYAGTSMARILITARARRIRDCARLRECVRQLDGYQGMISSIRVLFTRFTDVEDDYADPMKGSTVGTYMRRFDLHFKYREAIPFN